MRRITAVYLRVFSDLFCEHDGVLLDHRKAATGGSGLADGHVLQPVGFFALTERLI